MYVTDPRGSVYALDAADGHLLWTFDVTELIGGGAKAGYIFRNRGVCYADGVVYTGAGSFLFALDAKTGKPIKTFGKDGQASVILDVIKERYPDVTAAITLGYWFTTAPQIHNGVLYIGSTRSESHIPGGHVLAVDAKTGKVLWHFNTIPQDDKDQGWDMAGPTWVGGERNGGGIWETPSIDPELGLLYVAVGNPFGDSTKRIGTNLFTDSIIALSLSTGTLKWHFQQTHHDVWDYDSGNQPILFDMQVRGQRVKALAEASKNGYLYILNRETGQPVHPIKEMPVPTETTRPGEQPWPTQPIPVHRRRAADEAGLAGVSDRRPGRAPRGQQAGAAVHAAGTESDLRAGHRGRRQLRSAVLQSADRTALRQRRRQPARRPACRARVFFRVRSDHRRARVAADVRRLGPGRIGRHRRRPGLRRHRQQHRRLPLRLRREDRRAAVEVQHRRRRLLVAVGLHGERRGVRHRRRRAAASAAAAAAI